MNSKVIRRIAVQLLPVLKPQPQCPNGKILLCKWTSGDFKDRYTGMIHITDEELNPSDSSTTTQRQLGGVARSLCPVNIHKHIDSVELVSILQFDGPPDCDEYVYLATLKDQNQSLNLLENLKFGNHPCFWFDWDKIPFDQMPADDAIWYPKVLEGQKLTGFFNFGGIAERTIKSYELSTVQHFMDENLTSIAAIKKN